jgi:isoleucyl-tRNA synthetase
VLVTLSKLNAPFTPFFAETMYQNLTRSDGETKRQSDQGEDEALLCPISVHLCDYPAADEASIDERLAVEMELVRQLVSLGRAARTAAKLKVRQPLALVEVILARHEHEPWLQSHADLIAEELNIKQVEFATEADHYVDYYVVPNFKVLGPKFGKLAPRIAHTLKSIADAAGARKALMSTGELPLTVDGVDVRLTRDDIDIRLEAKPGWSAAQGRAGVVVVKTELTPELKQEGLIRELIHHVQSLRKDRDLAYEARITLYLQAGDDFVDVVRRFDETVRAECLAEQIEFAAPPGSAALTKKVEGHEVKLAIVERK